MIWKAGKPVTVKIRWKLRKTVVHAHWRQLFGVRPDILRLAAMTIAGWIAMPAALGTGAWGDAPAKVFAYRVIHPVYGDIGSYTNIIEDRGAEISVRNKFRVTVKVLFAVAYDQKGENTELWRNGRIVAFEGNMRKNGKKSVVRGRAEGDSFVIEGTRGRTVAPGTVFPNNPWSPKILETDVLMGTGSGKLYKVWSSPGDERVVEIDGKALKTRYFKVDGDARYELWFDESGVPVKFTDIGEDTTITYQLAERSMKPMPHVIKGAMATP